MQEMIAERQPVAVVLEAIENINRQLGTLTAVITHNSVIADMADRVIVLSDGLISEIRENSTRKSAGELLW